MKTSVQWVEMDGYKPAHQTMRAVRPNLVWASIGNLKNNYAILVLTTLSGIYRDIRAGRLTRAVLRDILTDVPMAWNRIECEIRFAALHVSKRECTFLGTLGVQRVAGTLEFDGRGRNTMGYLSPQQLFIAAPPERRPLTEKECLEYDNERVGLGAS